MLINEKQKAFTIVELLVVIVVIGILAAITIVSYSSINVRAITAVLESNLDSGSKLLKMYNVEHGYYPDSIDVNYCPNAPEIDNRYCLKPSSGTTLSYNGGGQSYALTTVHTASLLSYKITENGTMAIVDNSVPSTGTFAKAWGGTTYEVLSNLINTDDNGFAVTGYVASNMSTVGKVDLAKFNSDGSLDWNTTWNGTKFDSGSSLIKASDGGYVVTGTSQSFAVGNSDVLLAKFSSSGALVWNKNIGIGGSRGDGGYGVVEAASGGYVVTGSTINNNTYSIEDVFLSKFDINGNILWTRTWGTSESNDTGFKVINTNDGGFAVTGWAVGTRNTTSWDAFLNKYDANGILLWSRLWGGESSEHSYNIVQASNGDFVITGYTQSYTAGGYDMFLAKFSSTGDLIWSRTWGGTETDIGNGLVIAKDGNYLVSGTTSSFGAGDNDVFVAKYSPNGDLLWSKTWGGTSADGGGKIIQNNDSSIVVSGYTLGFGSGAYDALLLKFKSDVSMNNCSEAMCKTLTTVTQSSPTVSVVSDPSGYNLINDPVVTVGTPSATVSTFSGSFTSIVNP